ncbi:ATP-dependent DNA ligase [Microbispora triticiradicis]|uniref:DNA polymerase domain-containing protein n=3 Tax=Microbispora TaxID=2005 RepID=A0ABY3LTS6_9ACTN|nr:MULTISPECIES: non-homologous end-joining DNA ligase [Microbispora]RGA05203.1 ATP-dependent DNA ligase [Microbispora triticiradicis]TLP63771.1 ATP-dependent DNA ligase [Microbispora fusca]TYB52547.1 DNA polymerase domain-containing protein [Microbispora tritici]GLW20408.1 ATP-dependent DNA ligase [Microbispora amethystogenes]
MASPYIEIEVGDRVVKVTNPDKVYFPAIGATKRDLVTYYVSVGEGALRAMRERPTYLKRHPDGVGSEAIYQKRMPRHPDWIETVTVRFPSGRTADAFCPTEVAAIAWCANLGTIDFHPWHARRADLDHPDELRIDIDPQPGTSFEQARTVAFTAKEVLDELGMRGFPKTSGSRGVHVNVRIEPRWTFTEVRHAAIAFAREVERRTDLATTAWWKEERGEKVFIDYNQNARDRTVASAYSVRARPDGRVSAPVTWAELEDCDPGAFDLRTMPDRFAALGDVQREIDDRAFGIGTLLEWYDADERGDLPYPPNYPKMPGEPKRVQPSKARPSSGG